MQLRRQSVNLPIGSLEAKNIEANNECPASPGVLKISVASFVLGQAVPRGEAAMKAYMNLGSAASS